MVTFLRGRNCWKFLSEMNSEWKAYINTEKRFEEEEWLETRHQVPEQGSWLESIQSGPEFWYPVSLLIGMLFKKKKKSESLNRTHSTMVQINCLISIWVKQPRVQLEVIWTIWTCWDVMKAGNLMKTGFLLKFLALPFLVLFGETPRVQFLPIYHLGMSDLSQIREASKEPWK